MLLAVLEGESELRWGGAGREELGWEELRGE